MSDAVSCDHQGQGSVQMLMDDHLASRQSGAPFGTLQLHDQVVKAHGIIPINGALDSLRKDQLQIPVPAGYKCGTALRCRNGKAPVELGVARNPARSRGWPTKPAARMACRLLLPMSGKS